MQGDASETEGGKPRSQGDQSRKKRREMEYFAGEEPYFNGQSDDVVFGKGREGRKKQSP